MKRIEEKDRITYLFKVCRLDGMMWYHALLLQTCGLEKVGRNAEQFWPTVLHCKVDLV